MKETEENTGMLQTDTPEKQGKSQETNEKGNGGAADKQSGQRKDNPTGRFFLGIIDGRFLAKDTMVRWLPFLFFLTFLGLVYIANTYYGKKMVRMNDRTTRELKELRYEHITIKSQLMTLSKQSEVAKRLVGTGITESVVPPQKIFIPAPQESETKENWIPKTEVK